MAWPWTISNSILWQKLLNVYNITTLLQCTLLQIYKDQTNGDITITQIPISMFGDAQDSCADHWYNDIDMNFLCLEMGWAWTFRLAGVLPAVVTDHWSAYTAVYCYPKNSHMQLVICTLMCISGSIQRRNVEQTSIGHDFTVQISLNHIGYRATTRNH